MKIVMISNYINHHQIPFCDAMYARLGDDFSFIQTEEMEEERIKMGWGVDPASFPYVICSYKDEKKAESLVTDCDLLIAGWTNHPELIEKRLKAGKLTLRASERLYREGQWKFISPKGLIAKYKEHIRYNKAPVYALCIGAYTASDFELIGAYKNKRLKFGYFPATRRESFDKLCEKKGKLHAISIEMPEYLPEEPPTLTDKEIQIVWAGRMIPLKHPEYIAQLTSDLVRRGFRFHMHIVGDGEMMDDIKSYIESEMVEDYVTFYGFKSPEEVRDIMERCHIHLFTSNFIEGWGAVVNEGMNAGCVEIVNDEVGCAKYLIDDCKNGILYHDGSYEDLLIKVCSIMDQPNAIEAIGRAAYNTIMDEWNAETATDRMIEFYEGYIANNISIPQKGPLSVAEVIKPGFFKTGKLC